MFFSFNLFLFLLLLCLILNVTWKYLSPKWNPLILKALGPVVQGMDRTIHPIDTSKTYFVIHCRVLYTV